jgi:hypothetical protein
MKDGKWKMKRAITAQNFCPLAKSTDFISSAFRNGIAGVLAKFPLLLQNADLILAS